MIDLHTHTTCSDGTLSPKELMEHARDIGLISISVTDHDTVDCIKSGAQSALKFNVEFIPGVEIASMHNGFELHILGYYIDVENKDLLDFLIKTRQKRAERNEEMAALFRREGYDITLDKLKKLSGGPMISRVHFARLLVEKGYCTDILQAFDTLLAPGSKTHIRRSLNSPEEVIGIIKKAGGVVSLAHPGNYKRLDPNGMDLLVQELKTYGLDAIEAIYTNHSAEEERRFTSLARKYGLAITGGSDFHGMNKPKIRLGSGLGNLNIDYSVLEEIKKIKNQAFS
ncbi:MAG: PHP domain-containing protein [Clostridiales bacterium]|jgi:predicted metal-dependent phosphoesterase TrpH|nr:PHP domain-containing protein [Clostridiales bacterium]